MYLSIKPSAYVIVTDSMKLAPKPPQIPFFPPKLQLQACATPFQLPQLGPKLGTSETGHEALLDPQHDIQSHKIHKALHRRDALPPDKWKRYRDCRYEGGRSRQEPSLGSGISRERRSWKALSAKGKAEHVERIRR